MEQRTARNRIDMTRGPLMRGILLFILPLILTNLLQQFYHAADLMIVGLSSEPDAVGAVGSTGTFLGLITNLFIGFSVGSNVVIARYIGLKNRERVSRAAHTSIVLSILFGVIGAAIGIVLTRPVLVSMGYTGTLLTLGERYSYIFLLCMPFSALTNFLSAILRAQGNTRTTLYVLSGAGLLNVLLNFLFVVGFGMSVEGVAIATGISNAVSTVLLWAYIKRNGGDCALSFRALRIDRKEFLEILRIGLPAGIQNSLFSLSNIVVQSSILEVNQMLTPAGSAYAPIIQGNSAVGSIENFIFTALGATTVTASTFTAQNIGAKCYRRARKAFWDICLISSVIAVLMSVGGMLLRDPLLSLYGVENREDLLATLSYDASVKRMIWKWPAFFIYAIMNACGGTIRGLGRSSTSAVITFFGTCVFRIAWIYTAFRYFRNLESIYISYPISWFLTGVFFLGVVFFLFSKYRNLPEEAPDPE
jgi:putative MATE family efflux protein